MSGDDALRLFATVLTFGGLGLGFVEGFLTWKAVERPDRLTRSAGVLFAWSGLLMPRTLEGDPPALGVCLLTVALAVMGLVLPRRPGAWVTVVGLATLFGLSARASWLEGKLWNATALAIVVLAVIAVVGRGHWRGRTHA